MFCNKCGKQIPDGSAFCDGCGAAMNAPAAPVQEPAAAPAPVAAPPVATPPVAAPPPAPTFIDNEIDRTIAVSHAPTADPMMNNGMPVAPQYQQAPQFNQMPAPAPAPQKKKLSTLAIILIIVGVLALAGIGYAAEAYFQNEDKKETSSSKEESSSQTDSNAGSTLSNPTGENNGTGDITLKGEVNSELNDPTPVVPELEVEVPENDLNFPYQLGSVSNGQYTNQWVGITIDTNIFGRITDRATLDDNSNEKITFDFEGINGNDHVIVSFERTDVTPEECFENWIPGTPTYTTTIGGAPYLAASFNNGDEHQITYCRRVNEYLVYIDIYAATESEASAYLAYIY